VSAVPADPDTTIGLVAGLAIVVVSLVVCWFALRLVLRETVKLSEGVAQDHRRDQAAPRG